MFYSLQPRRYIWALECRNWTPPSVFCATNSSYGSLFLHGDDDIEYYEYEDGDDEGWGATKIHLRKQIAELMKMAPDRVVRRNSKTGYTEKKIGNVLLRYFKCSIYPIFRNYGKIGFTIIRDLDFRDRYIVFFLLNLLIWKH